QPHRGRRGGGQGRRRRRRGRQDADAEEVRVGRGGLTHPPFIPATAGIPSGQSSGNVIAGSPLRGDERSDYTSSNASAANSARSWMNSKRASGLLPISRSTDLSVGLTSSATSLTRSSVRLAGSIVVSFNCDA